MKLTPAQAKERDTYLYVYKTVSDYGERSHAAPFRALISGTEMKSLLDVGCGKGAFLRWVCDNDIVSGNVAAVDFAAQPNIPDSVDFKTAAAHDLPWEDNSFDYVTAFDVLEHIAPEDVDAVLAELSRVASRGMIFTIAHFRSRKLGPNGEEVHLTVKPEPWWLSRIEKVTGARVEVWNVGGKRAVHCTLP
jgi:ubiquinone/menaquinone biosynthesis C-methylase UbiE